MSTKIVGHRGAGGAAPENTMSAFAEAIKLGADGIELDIQSTADGELVVFHDMNLDRTTDGEGLVVSRSSEYISGLDAGSWFDARFAGEKVPMLSDVLDTFGGQTTFDLDLTGFNADFVHAVLELVGEFNLYDDCRITSSQLPLLLIARDQHPDARITLFSHPYESWMSTQLWQALEMTDIRLLDGEAACIPIDLLDANFAERVADADVLINAVLCDSEEQITKALDLDVHQLTTNNVEIAVKLAANR